MTASFIISLSWIAFVVVWLVTAVRSKPSVPSRPRVLGPWARIGFAIIFFIVLKVNKFSFSSLQFNQPQFAWIGAALTALGIGIAIWARMYLGENWGRPMTRRQRPALVTTGPYHWVRHPIYSGVLLAMLGTSVALSFWFLIALALMGSYFVYSAVREEKDMRQEFGEMYAAYVARSKMLVPFVF